MKSPKFSSSVEVADVIDLSLTGLWCRTLGHPER